MAKPLRVTADQLRQYLKQPRRQPKLPTSREERALQPRDAPGFVATHHLAAAVPCLCCLEPVTELVQLHLESARVCVPCGQKQRRHGRG